MHGRVGSCSPTASELFLPHSLDSSRRLTSFHVPHFRPYCRNPTIYPNDCHSTLLLYQYPALFHGIPFHRTSMCSALRFYCRLPRYGSEGLPLSPARHSIFHLVTHVNSQAIDGDCPLFHVWQPLVELLLRSSKLQHPAELGS